MNPNARFALPAVALFLSAIACGSPSPGSPAASPAPTLNAPVAVPSSTAIVSLPPTVPVATAPAPVRSAPQPADRSHFQDGQDLKLTEVRMVDATDGWGKAGPFVLRTRDGGLTWEEVTPPATDIDPATGEAFAGFADASNAWVVFSTASQIPSETTIWATMDGGETWSPAAISHEARGEMVWATFSVADANTAWVAIRGVFAGAGTHYVASFLRTTDGGASWNPLEGDVGVDYTGMAFANADVGWLTWETTGAYAPAPPDYAVTQDGGVTWDVRSLPAPDDAPTLFDDFEYSEPYQPDLISAESARLLVGAFHYDYGASGSRNYLYLTDDGGDHWQIHALPAGVLASEATLVFFDPEAALLMGRDMYRTENAGQSWEHVKTVFWDGQFSFVDPLHGWAVARSGDALALVRTVDGGASWVELKPTAIR